MFYTTDWIFSLTCDGGGGDSSAGRGGGDPWHGYSQDHPRTGPHPQQILTHHQRRNP